MAKSNEFGVHEISLLLAARRKEHRTTVLLLGSRAGALFRSPQFYETMQQYSSRSFHPLTLLKRFQECYNILTGHQFGERDIYSLLRTSLSEIGISKSDACLAALIKQGHFEEIVSTNGDNVLEQALMKADMVEGRDYEVYVPGLQRLQFEREHMPRITKAYGELQVRTYAASTRLLRLEDDDNEELKHYLEHLFAKDIIILGFDPFWDRDILHAFPPKGGEVWFVNEEKPVAKSRIATLLKERRARSITGGEGTYAHFITQLYEHLCDEMLPINYRLGHEILEQIQMLREEHQIIIEELRELRKMQK